MTLRVRDLRERLPVDAVQEIGERGIRHLRLGLARVRERHLWQVAAIPHRFVFSHRACIARVAGRDWTTVTIVPSKTVGASGSRRWL